MPEPKNFNNREDFIKACMPIMINEGKTQEQAYAICSNRWESKELQTDQTIQSPQTSKSQIPKGKIDIIAEIKKLINKNGMTISEEKLLSLLGEIKIHGLTMKQRIDIAENQTVNPIESQSILALPRGKHYVTTYNYEGWKDFNDGLFKDIISNFYNPALNKPYIDKDHDDTVSLGTWVNPRIEAKGLYVDLILNKDGLQLVKDKVYNYYSPTIINNFKDGKGKSVKNWMASISFVNSPALLGAIPMLSEQLVLKLNLKRKEKTKMENIILQNNFTKILELSKELGKPLTLAGEMTEPETIVAVLPEIVELLKAALLKIQELIGEKETAETEMQIAQEAVLKANTELTAMKNQEKEKEVENLLQNALELEYFRPVVAESMKKLLMKNQDFLEETEKNILAMKKDNPIENQNQFTSSGASQNDLKLSKEDEEIAKSAGYDLTKPEDRKLFFKMKEDK